MMEEEFRDIQQIINISEVNRLKDNKLITHVLDIDLSDLYLLKFSSFNYIKGEDSLIQTILPDYLNYALISEEIDSFIMFEVLNRIVNHKIIDNLTCVHILENLSERYNVNCSINSYSVDTFNMYCSVIKQQYWIITSKFELEKYNYLTYKLNATIREDSYSLSHTIVILSDRVKYDYNTN